MYLFQCIHKVIKIGANKLSEIKNGTITINSIE